MNSKLKLLWSWKAENAKIWVRSLNFCGNKQIDQFIFEQIVAEWRIFKKLFHLSKVGIDWSELVSCWENWNLERLLRKCFVLHYFSHRRLTQIWFRFNPDITMALFRAKNCSWKFQILCKWHVEYIVNGLIATVLDYIKMKGYLISIPTGFLKQTVIFNSVRGRENVESSLLVTVSKPFMFCSRYIFWNTVFETSDICVNHRILSCKSAVWL